MLVAAAGAPTHCRLAVCARGAAELLLILAAAGLLPLILALHACSRGRLGRQVGTGAPETEARAALPAALGTLFAEPRPRQQQVAGATACAVGGRARGRGLTLCGGLDVGIGQQHYDLDAQRHRAPLLGAVAGAGARADAALRVQPLALDLRPHRVQAGRA